MSSRIRSAVAALPAPLRSAVIYAAGIAWARGLSLLMIPLMTATLLPSEFGRLELLSSAAEIAALLASAGMLETLFRFAGPSDQAGRSAGAAVTGLACALACVAFAIFLPAASTIASLLPLRASTLEIVLLSISIAVEAIIVVTTGWMRLEGRAGMFVAVTASRATIQSAIVAALLLNGWGVLGILAGGAIVTATTAACLLGRQARQTGITAVPHQWSRFLGYGLPLIGAGLANFAMGTADRWLLAPSAGAEELGRYALAVKFALVSSLVMQPFELWWYPRRLAILREPDGLARSARATDAGISLAIVAAAGTATLGPALINMLTPIAYHPASVWVPWLAASVALQAAGSLCNVGSYAGRTTALPLIVNVSAAIVAITGYIFLIPPYGVSGAVAATVASQATRLAFFLAVSLRRAAVPHRGWALTGLAAAGVASASMPRWFLEPGLGASAAGLAGACLVGVLAIVYGLFPFPGLTRLQRPSHA